MSGIFQNNDIRFFVCNPSAKRHLNCLPGHRIVKFLSCVGRNAVSGSRVVEVEEQRPIAATAMRWRRSRDLGRERLLAAFFRRSAVLSLPPCAKVAVLFRKQPHGAGHG